MVIPPLTTIVIAILIGFVPICFWLWFWLRNDKHPEPRLLLLASFLVGAVLVFPVISLQGIFHEAFAGSPSLIVLTSAIEEIAKFLVILILVLGSRYIDEPLDYGIYLITGALGFSAFENILYLLNPSVLDSSLITALTIGNSRFIGASVVHGVCAAIVGISMGVAFYKPKVVRIFFTLFGIGGAITLHALFNFFILQSEKVSLLTILALLWVVGIIIVISFRRLAELSPIYYYQQP